MTGPPYPHPNPAPGSNAIGSFTIGVSPIGTIQPFDFWKTFLDQYANSPAISQILSNFDQYLDQTQNLDAFFDNIWNVDTAQGYGLDLWGRIVGVSRTVFVAGTQKFFGFEEATTISADPFNQSPFYSGGTLTNNFQLSDTAFRLLILAKALTNISDGSTRSINQILLNLFPGRGNAFAVDGAPDGTTQLLLHMNGPAGSSFFDSSSLSSPVTAVGNASISAFVNEFGGPTSGAFTGGWLTVPSAPQYNLQGDFTIDFWAYPTLHNSVRQEIISKASSPTFPPNPSWDFRIGQDSNWKIFASSTGAVNGDVINGNAILTPAQFNVWQHVAAVRQGNSVFLFLNGTLGASGTATGFPFVISNPVTIGAATGSTGGFPFTGFLGDVRISTKALWTSSFTPPPGPVSAGSPMTMEYLFNFGLSSVELAILSQTGVLPKPVGVAATIVET